MVILKMSDVGGAKEREFCRQLTQIFRSPVVISLR